MIINGEIRDFDFVPFIVKRTESTSEKVCSLRVY